MHAISSRICFQVFWFFCNLLRERFNNVVKISEKMMAWRKTPTIILKEEKNKQFLLSVTIFNLIPARALLSHSMNIAQPLLLYAKGSFHSWHCYCYYYSRCPMYMPLVVCHPMNSASDAAPRLILTRKIYFLNFSLSTSIICTRLVGMYLVSRAIFIYVTESLYLLRNSQISSIRNFHLQNETSLALHLSLTSSDHVLCGSTAAVCF